MNQIDPLEILGKDFLEIKNLPRHNGIEKVLEDLEEGEEKEYFISAKDGTREIILGKNNRIETIFLYLDNNCKGILGITKLMNSAEIIKLMGKPTNSGEKRFDSILGKYGAWERYNFNNYCVHIEHNFNDTEVKQITLMLPNIAP